MELPGLIESWEPLFTGTGEGHLETMAVLAKAYAGKFSAAEWHDLGNLK